MHSDAVLDAAWRIAGAEAAFNREVLILAYLYVFPPVYPATLAVQQASRDQARDALLEAKGMRPRGRQRA